jgi:hypothetical protein
MASVLMSDEKDIEQQARKKLGDIYKLIDVRRTRDNQWFDEGVGHQGAFRGFDYKCLKQLFVVRGVMSQRWPPWQRRESQAREKQADDHYALHRSRDERAWEWFRLRHRPPTAKNVGERRNDADDADDRSRYAAAAQRLDASHIPISVIWFPI